MDVISALTQHPSTESANTSMLTLEQLDLLFVQTVHVDLSILISSGIRMCKTALLHPMTFPGAAVGKRGS